MSRLVGRVALLAAVGLTLPGSGSAESLRGTLSLAPLSADWASLRQERPTLVRLPGERGPLFPYVDPETLRVEVACSSAILVTGAPCPEGVALGSSVTLENLGDTDWSGLVGLSEEPVVLAPGERLELAAAPDQPDEAESPELLATVAPGSLTVQELEGDWRCELMLGEREAVGAMPRPAGPGLLSVRFGPVAWPQGRRPDTLDVRLWLNEAPLCPGDESGECAWTVPLRVDAGGAFFGPITLDLETLRPDVGGP